MSQIPAEILTLVDALGLRHQAVDEVLSHLYGVTTELGFVGGKTVGAAALYAYLTDGRSELGERLRRSLSAAERLRAVDSCRVAEVLATFRDDAGHIDLDEVRSTATWIGSNCPQFAGDVEAFAFLLAPLLTTHSTPSLTASVDAILGVDHAVSEVRAAKFIRDLLSNTDTLAVPGNYVLIITDDGTSYQADISQILIRGRVVETQAHGSLNAPTASVSYPWIGAVAPSIRGVVEEFESLINSVVAKEGDFQRFFNRKPEFLYLLGNYDDVRSQVTIRVDSAITPLQSSRTYRPDFFLHNPLTNLWDALDIKKAAYRRSLVVGSGAAAHDRLRPAAALARALEQMRAYQKLLEQAKAREFLRTNYRMLVSRPRCILLMGREVNFPGIDGFSESELLRAVDDKVDVVTYDQLHRVTRHMYQL